MGTMVVGIFPNHDALTKLTGALKTGGFDVERLRVLSNESPSEHLAQSGVQFVSSGEAEESAISGGVGIITSSGVGVPGLGGSSVRLEQLHPARTVEDSFVDFGIPNTRWHDYAKAVDGGASVACYLSGADPDTLRALFSASGGDPVELF